MDNSVEIQAINLTQHLNEQLPKLKNGKQGLRLILLPINTGSSQINLPNLSPLFQSIDVNFCISCNIFKEEIDQYLTQNQTKPIINFQVSHQNFFPIWHQTICDRNISSLNTGIVIADIETLRSLLNEILQLEPNCPQINIQENKITVLFYPSYQNKAVIQAINISLLSAQN